MLYKLNDILKFSENANNWSEFSLKKWTDTPMDFNMNLWLHRYDLNLNKNKAEIKWFPTLEIITLETSYQLLWKVIIWSIKKDI